MSLGEVVIATVLAGVSLLHLQDQGKMQKCAQEYMKNEACTYVYTQCMQKEFPHQFLKARDDELMRNVNREK